MSMQARLEAAFAVFDTDGDGKLDCDEVESILTRGGSIITEQDARRLIREFDIDNDRRLSIDEFVRAFAHAGFAATSTVSADRAANALQSRMGVLKPNMVSADEAYELAKSGDHRALAAHLADGGDPNALHSVWHASCLRIAVEKGHAECVEGTPSRE